MRREIVKLIILVITLAVLLIPFINMASFAKAEDAEYFIICEPDGIVNVREKPNVKSSIVACMFFADRIHVDKEKNGFVHVTGINAEVTHGWIYKGLVVEDEPTAVNQTAQVYNAGRVACRKYADGKIKRWLKDGEEVTVLCTSKEWCVTNYGYIKTDYLTINPKVR